MADMPQIRYVTTSDGLNIAYVAEGSGPVAISMMYGMPYAGLIRLEVDEQARILLRNSAQFCVSVRFDQRGMGHSDRTVDDFSIDAMVRDYEAVVDLVDQGDGVWLLANATSTPAAIAFAGRHPERVTRLVLRFPFSYGAEISTGEWNGFIELADRDWEMACQSLPPAFLAWENLEQAKVDTEVMRRSMTPQAYVATARALQQCDVRGDLPAIQCPTLVLHRRQFRYMSLEGAQRVAAAIPNALFRVFDGASSWMDNDEALVLLNFLLGRGEYESLATVVSRTDVETKPANLQTVLFTDLVGHTAMMSRLGDDRGRDVLREHERITREVLKAHGGTEVKTMGDGFMASFGSVTKAVECAVALQRKFEVRREKLEVEDLSVRVGLNAGEPIEEDGDLFGATVILASRIAGKAEGGEILVADTVRGLCSGKGFLFSDRGEFNAKGFDEPVRVYEVRWRE